MALPKREWLETFTPEVLSDVRAAATYLMGRICDHAPEDCGCELNRFTPLEFCEWLEMESERERGKPTRIEPAGRPNRRRDGEFRVSMATAS